MPSNAKDKHWKILPSKPPEAAAATATTLASFWTRPKQLFPDGKQLLCNPSFGGGDAGGGPIYHRQNHSGIGREKMFPIGRRSVLPPYRPHDQQRQPLFDFPPAISPAFAFPGGPRRKSKQLENDAATIEAEAAWASRFSSGIMGSAPIDKPTPQPDRGLPGPRGENISSSIGSRNPSPTITHQRRPGGDAAIRYGHDKRLRVTPGGFRPSEAQALTPISERANPTAPLSTFGGGGNPHSGSSIPICQLIADFRASLHRRMQSVFSSPSHATLHPGLEGLTSTVLIALIGLEKTL